MADLPNVRVAAPATPLLVDSKTVCQMTSLGERKVWELSNCQAIPSVKIGTARRFVVAEVQAWVRMGCPTAPGSADHVRAAMKKGRA